MSSDTLQKSVPRLLCVAQSRSSISFMSYVATKDNGRTANQLGEMSGSMKEFLPEQCNSSLQLPSLVGTKTTEVTCLQLLAAKSITFLVLRCIRESNISVSILCPVCSSVQYCSSQTKVKKRGTGCARLSTFRAKIACIHS